MSKDLNVGNVIGRAIGVAMAVAAIYTVWVGILAFSGGFLVWWLLPIALPVVNIGYWQSVLLVVVVNLVLLPLKTDYTSKVEQK